METKRKIQQALQKIARAELEEALPLLRDLIVDIEDAPKVDIIIRCCKLCTSNVSSPDCISDAFLYEMLVLIVSSVQSFNEANVLSFMQSMYHIVRFLVVKGSYETVAKMEDIMFPKILPPPSQLSKKVQETYSAALASYIMKHLQKIGAQDRTLLLMCRLTFRLCFFSTDLRQALPIVETYLSMKMENHTREIVYDNFIEFVRSKCLPRGCAESFRNLLHILSSMLIPFAETGDFIGFREFYERATKQCNTLLRHEEYWHLQNVLQFPLFFANIDKNYGASEMESCKGSLKALDVSIESQKVRKDVSTFLDVLMEHALRFQTVADTWSQLDEEFQLSCLDFIYDLSSFESKLEQECTCKCSAKRIYQAGFYVKYITTLIRSYITAEKPTTEYHQNCCRMLEKFYGYIVQLKENHCKKLEAGWEYLIVRTYNIGVKLWEAYLNKDAAIYFKFVINKYHQFGGRYCAATLTHSLHGLCKVLANDHEAMLAVTALSMHLSPDEAQIYIAAFTKSKYAMASDAAKEITVVSAFSDLKHHLSFLSKPIELSKEEQIKLLRFELEYYKKKWKSKVPMMAAFTELITIADLEVVVQTAVEVFGDGELAVHEKLPEVFSEILRKYEESNPPPSYNLAVLNLLNYRYKNQEARTRNIAEMERVVNFLIKTKSEPDKEDPNEGCDVVFGFDSLKLDNFINHLNFLDKALESLAKIRCEFQPGAFDVLLRIYYEYRLHQHKIPALRALKLALDQAGMEKNAANIITVISFILEESDVSKKFVKDLILQADQFLSELDRCNVTHLKLIVMYYLSRSKAHLYADYEQTVEYYKKAKYILEEKESPDFNILRCHFNMLSHRIILLPCNRKNRAEHADLSLLNMDLAVSALFEEYSEKRLEGSYGMLLLFEFSEELTKFYYSIRCPREVRCYCKEVIHLAQKLLLPLRSATLLQYLAYADLRTNRLDDAQYKLNSMAEILCLNKTRILEVPQPTVKTDLESEVGSATDSLREMVLDEPSDSQYRYRDIERCRSSSPIFDTQPFQIPSFVHHPKSCDCIFCSCLQYQILVLEKSRLDALINIKRANFAAAKDILASALHFYECCDTRYRYLQDNLTKEMVPCFEDAAFQAYGSVLLDYSYHLRRMGNREKAIDINITLLNLLMPRKARYVYLHHEAAMQRLGYLTEVPDVVSPVEEESDDELEENATKGFQRTPEEKTAKVVFMISPDHDTDELEGPKKTRKKIPFYLSPSPDRRAKTPVAKKSSSVSTPSVKIPIFTDTCSTTKRSTRKKLEMVPSNVNAMKPPTSTNDVNLKSRTKLLTEKLKQSSKKVRDPSAESTSGESSGGAGSLTRKKLFSDDSSKEPTVRRSQRTRKK